MSPLGCTDERVDILNKLWQDGLSASQIAKRLGGVTRNAVIGKVHRLGLSGRATPSAPGRSMVKIPRRTPRPRSQRARPIAPPRLRLVARAPIEAAPEGPGLVACMTGLGAHMCKWPIGDPKSEAFSFCGRCAKGEGPYCASHDQTAHRLSRLKPLDQDPLLRRVLAGLAA
jgi:GcrA cell cycle regulator